ncbi:hypothetical protein [Streptomyces sp. MK5]|uniref:hypothetical protein n=1 Tax=Streptomyces sp. MK5 TaxID=3064253 RepID=UPI0027416CFE|nr:hypothetical protein [Streptomyces sp. MK5]
MTTTPFTSREGMTRRRMLAAAPAVGAAVSMGVARRAQPRRRTTAAAEAYPLAFFDLHLRHRGKAHLLDGPCPAFPEVKFIP